jgi:phosphoglycerol transferase
MKKKRLSKVIICFILFLGFIIDYLYIYLNNYFQNVTFEQLLYTAFTSVDASVNAWIGGACFVVGLSFLSLFLILIIYKLINKYSKLNINFIISIKNRCFNIKLFKLTNKSKWVISILFLIISILMFSINIGLFDYIKNQMQNTLIYEDYYVDGKDVELTFPSEKQNLIYIFVESLETANFSYENGGGLTESYIPNLEKLALNNINFSNKDNLGGFYTVYGTGWTAASMIAQTSGLPLNIPINGNLYSGYGESLPGAYTIGDILEANGYHNYLMMGSSADFAGRRDYFTYHGNYEIYDYNYAITNNWIDEDYYVWWGYEDSKLYSFAKDELLKISQNDEPFNFTILTADTHFPNGYVDSSCDVKFDEQYANSFYCTDSMLYNFIKWIQKQDFYENTTIVIVGDHDTMQANFYTDSTSYYDGTVYNTIINSKVDAINEKNRTFSVFDMYPTTLAALGVQISGDKLGFGTNLFSSEQTILEKVGITYFNTELAKKSFYYDNYILGSTYYKMINSS